MRFEITAPDQDRLLAAMRTAPAALERHMDRALGRIALTVASAARRAAPKATTALANSILPRRISALEYHVAPGMDYAADVEYGAGPGGGTPGQPRAILDWVRARRIAPRDPHMTQEDLAYVIARSIARHGAPPQPYLEPALEQHRATAEQRIDAAITAALNDIARGA